MTPSTINRLARLYERVVGYHPFEDGDWTPIEALDGLRWMRTALILCNDDPTAYTGSIRTKAQLAHSARIGRYSKIHDWAKARYADSTGRVTTRVGNAIAGRPTTGPAAIVPTRYAMIEDLAARRYLRCKPRWSHETLATAHRA